MKGIGRRATTLALLGLTPLAAVAAGVGISVGRTEILRSSLEQQVWVDARYPNAELLGAWVGVGDLVQAGLGAAEGPGQPRAVGARCDFVAQGVYGTNDDYEQVEAHYRHQAVSLGAGPPVALDVRPVAAGLLETREAGRRVADEATLDVLRRTGTPLARAAAFPTIYTVEVVSAGHAAWLDWRCR